jgi:RND family efflux transporter MFP subunit
VDFRGAAIYLAGDGVYIEPIEETRGLGVGPRGMGVGMVMGEAMANALGAIRRGGSRPAALPALGLALALALAAFPGAVAAQQPAMVQVDPVVTEQLVQTVPILGRIVAMQDGPVAARVAGPVAEVAVDVGDRVATGDLLAVLDVTRLELDRELARADLATAEAELLAARRELELVEQERARLVQLEGSAAFSRARLDDKIKEANVAASRIDAAAARLARAQVLLDYREADLADGSIRAPFPGVVTARHVSAGAHLQVGQPVVTLVDDINLELEADVPAERLAELEAGIELTFALADGGSHEAVLRAIVPVENPMTRTRAVRFSSLNGGLVQARAIGQTVTVDFPVGATREVVTVHKDAVTVSLQGRQVFVVDDEDKAQPRPVVLGTSVGNRFEVLDGLQPGELVVVRGNERLQPGQAVAYTAPDGEAAPAAATTAGDRG